MPGKPGLTGGTESTRHGAPGLAADADGGPVGVQHQHGLDATAAVKFPEELHGVAGFINRFGDQRQRSGELLIETFP